MIGTSEPLRSEFWEDYPSFAARDGTTVAALVHGLGILRLLALSHGGLTLSEVAERTGIGKTTVFRLLSTLFHTAALSHLPLEVLEAYLDRGPFRAFPERTITDPEALREQLEQVRQQGFAIAEGEWIPSVRNVAAPGRNFDGNVSAGVGISSHDLRPRDGVKGLPRSLGTCRLWARQRRVCPSASRITPPTLSDREREDSSATSAAYRWIASGGHQ